MPKFIGYLNHLVFKNSIVQMLPQTLVQMGWVPTAFSSSIVLNKNRKSLDHGNDKTSCGYHHVTRSRAVGTSPHNLHRDFCSMRCSTILLKPYFLVLKILKTIQVEIKKLSQNVDKANNDVSRNRKKAFHEDKVEK